MPINTDTLNAIISGLNTMPKKSEIDTPTNNIDLLATNTTDGLMSSSDKSKLDGIAVGANKYVHPETSGNKHIPSGGSDGQILKWESDGTAKWATETKYGLATETSGGLMSSTDKINLDAAVSKLSGIAEGANNYSLPIASNSRLGGVKTTSTVTNTNGLTACPIIDGVPYYMGTVGSYTLPTASNTTLGGVTTTSNVTSTTGLTACPIIAGIPYYANAYTHPSHTAHGSGLYKVAVDALGHVNTASAVTKEDIVALGIPGSTPGLATTEAHGLLSNTDFTFISNYKKYKNANTTFEFSSYDESKIRLEYCFGNCVNGLVILTGTIVHFIEENVENAIFASGTFPSPITSFVCGFIANVSTPNSNNRLYVRHEPDGQSTLQCGGDFTTGIYNFLAVYPVESCAYNLPY